MECDDDGPPRGVQSLGQDCGENGLEVFQLAVDGNSQGLEHPRGRMSVGPPGLRVKGFVDGFDQISRRPNGPIRAAKYDRASN